MTIHKEGHKILIGLLLALSVINSIVYIFVPLLWVFYVVLGITSVIFLLVLQFFRLPKRVAELNENHVVCPADGKVVAIEEVEETEYFKEKRLQVSVFMSPFNVHVNWYPIGGIVKFFKYHPGLFLVAWHPKSSTENERTTLVLENEAGKEVLVRQIAGAVARRIVAYSKEKTNVKQGTQLGFIKFGSRVDLFLPLDAKVKVKIDQKVQGNKDVIAEI